MTIIDPKVEICPDEWASQVFSQPIVNMTVTSPPITSSLFKTLLKEGIRRYSAEKYIIVTKVSAGSVYLLLYENVGFRVMEVRGMFHKDEINNKQKEDDSILINPSLPHVKDWVSSFSFYFDTHWARDYRTKERIEDFYKQWLLGYKIPWMEKYPRKLLVYKSEYDKSEYGDSMIGYNLFHVNTEDNIAEIESIAVDVEHRGKGIGSKLVSYMEKFLPTGCKIELGTQLDNLNAVKMYLSNGYELKEVKLVLHR